MFPPDCPITELGKLQEHFRGGTGEPWDWPKILPMWWGYKNPVSGRQPELFLPDCVPCGYAPGMSMVKAWLSAATRRSGAQRGLSWVLKQMNNPRVSWALFRR